MRSVKHKLFAPIARKISIGVVIISVLAVAGNLAASAYFSPEKIVEREMTKIAKDYYENYFYENYTEKYLSQKDKLERLEKNGFPYVYLRQLLHYDNGKHADSAPNFRYEGYTCDTNKTHVIFYPTVPYGRTDYRAEYHYECK
ncbi:hypothetical protein IJJ18_03045 [Candidatus Saccharibacteria bacterium]|nr:hypothetical protein [Candidatus Saccharibacteria bacterium]